MRTKQTQYKKIKEKNKPKPKNENTEIIQKKYCVKKIKT